MTVEKYEANQAERGRQQTRNQHQTSALRKMVK